MNASLVHARLLCLIPRRIGPVAAAVLFCGLLSASAENLASLNSKVDKIFSEAVAPQTARPPSTGPKPVAGKNIVVIPCAMAAEGCARQVRGVVEAAPMLGWKVTLIDPAGDNAKMAQAVQKAISIKADGIILASIDASLIQGPLREAKQAGIKLVAEGTNTDGLYDYTALSPEFYVNQGYVVAAAGYKLGGNKLHLIEMDDNEFAAVRSRADGTKAFLKECQAAGGDCKLIAEQNTLVSELTTVVPQQTVALVRLHPDYNVLWAGYDAALNFMIQGLQQASLTENGLAVGFDANVANLGIIKKGGFERATLGIPIEWMGYGMVDAMNRLFAGEPTVDEGVRSRLITKDNMPSSGAWEGDMDYKAAYKTLWQGK